VSKVSRPDADTIPDLIRERRVDLVVNTPLGRGARGDGHEIRRAAIAARVPVITTLSGASAAVQAIARAWNVEGKPLQELLGGRVGAGGR
jgi:carbamoyl-phosphate synthase large subunit